MTNSLLTEIDTLQKKINSFRALESSAAFNRVKGYYRVGLTYSSNVLEGNSLTESETKIVIEEGLTIGGKPLRDHFEAIGHSEAVDFIYTLTKQKDIMESEIKHLHEIFHHRIAKEKAGKYRTEKVCITGSKYLFPAPEKIQRLMTVFIQKLSLSKQEKHPVEVAALAHKEFVFIHPFIDGSGGVARLLMNLILLQGGYHVAIIPPVLRSEYAQTLEKAHTDDTDFMEFIARVIRESQKDYLRLFK